MKGATPNLPNEEVNRLKRSRWIKNQNGVKMGQNSQKEIRKLWRYTALNSKRAKALRMSQQGDRTFFKPLQTFINFYKRIITLINSMKAKKEFCTKCDPRLYMTLLMELNF